MPPEPAPDPSDATLVPRAPAPKSFASGRYQVRRILGEGGQKVVYLVHDEALDRDCALSMIKSELLDADDLLRLQREAQAMARLGAHSNIVSVFDFGQEDAKPYLVCEYVPAGELRGELRKAGGPLQLERALTIAADIARGLAIAHGRGIFHRDIKPANVWLCEDGSAKLGDFGLAFSLDQSRLTMPGTVMGTAIYMAPEQALGRPVDARTDLYSLGALLYEMVCGRPPFVDENPTAVIAQHINARPSAPSEHRPDLPAALDALILSMLAKSPDERPTSAAAVSEELQRITESLRQPGGADIRAQGFPRPTAPELRGQTDTPDIAEGITLTGQLPEGTVTILFTDVVGSTELTTRLGDEPAREVLGGCDELVRRQVERHRGHEVKGTGDGLMAAFTSARRAVACAIDIQRALAQRNQHAPSSSLRLRIGLNTGEVVREEADLFGSTVNAAARIQAAAEPGEILVSEGVKIMLGAGTTVQLEDRGETELRGFSEPWRLYSVRWQEADGAAHLSLSGRTPYVGRDEERARLRRLAEQAANGQGTLVMIGGEAGVGKSRLAEELVAEARAKGMFTAVGRCYEMEGAPPYIPFVEVIDYAARVVPPEDLLRTLGDSAPEVAKLAPRLRRIVPDLGEPLDLPPEQARHYMFESVCDFLERGSRIQPMMLVFDDLHWADDSSCLLLEHLAERVKDMAILAVGTYRDVELVAETPLTRSLEQLIRRRLAHQLLLRRFGAGEVRLMLASLGGKEPPAGLVRVIFDETEGVPYFVEEVFRYLLEAGRLFDAEGGWRSDVQLGEIEVPASVRLVIRRRLERVSEPTRQILTLAAAVGRDFTYEFLKALSQSEEEKLFDAVEEAESACLIRSTEGAVPHFAFWHEQIRQTLLAGLSFPRRQRLHLRVAETMEKLYAGSLDEHVADLAFQLSLAGEGYRAVEYLSLAGEHAASGYASTEALEYFQRALDMNPPTPQRRRILQQRAKLLLGLFRGREAAHDLEQLLDAARESEDRVTELQALRDLGSAYYTIALDEPAALDNAREVLERAYALAKELGDKAMMAWSLIPTHRFTDFWSGYQDKARANLQEALALGEEIGDEEIVLEARRVALRFVPGVKAEAEAEDIRAALESKHQLVRLNEHLFQLMWLYYGRGKFERCIECCDSGTRLARRIGSEPVQYASINGLALLDVGRFGEAWDSFQREVADDAHPFGRAHRDVGIAAYLLELTAYERAEQAARTVIEQARTLSRPWMVRWAQMILARSLAAAGRLHGREADTVRSEIEAAGGFPCADALAEALLAGGAAADALMEAEKNMAGSEAGGRGRDYVPALELKARALINLGRPAEALSLLDEALTRATDMGYRRVLWRVQRTRGEAYSALGDPDAAKGSYQEAAVVLRTLAGTIADAELKNGFLSNPVVVSTLNAAQSGN